jgi:hypothetical protein
MNTFLIDTRLCVCVCVCVKYKVGNDITSINNYSAPITTKSVYNYNEMKKCYILLFADVVYFEVPKD